MGVLAELLDLALPAGCICCHRPGSVWCPGCQPPSVGQPVGPGVFAAGEYAGDLRTALVHYKERGRRPLGPPLAGYLADAVDAAARAAAVPAPVLVPVPSRRSAARQRGGDHMLRLARAAARQLGVSVQPVLRLSGPVLDSVGLDHARRRANLAGRMRADPARAGSRVAVVVVDDITTSGTSLAEAQRALTAAGWPVAGSAVIAWVRRAGPASA